MTEKLIARLAREEITIWDLRLAYIYATLKRHKGNRADAAKVLGMNLNYLYKLVKDQGWTEFQGRPWGRRKVA